MQKRLELKKINEQWAGIPREQLLNQSFNNQLNSIQLLKQLAPLQLTRDHLLGDIIDILERLGKANNIPHNQLYYIVENCTDQYYNKVIETFTLLLKRQIADRQLLLNNTARSLKFLEDYANRQALIWEIFNKHQNIPDNIFNLHLHINDMSMIYQLSKLPHHIALHKNLCMHMAEEEDKPTESNYMGTDPLGPTHDPYRVGSRGKSKRLSS